MQKGYAQVQTAIIGTGTSTSVSYGPTYLSSPIQKTTNHGHYIYLFTEDELLAQGITPGSVISEVAWTKGSVTLLAKGAIGVLNVSMKSGYALPEYLAAFPILSYTSSFTLAGSRSFNSDTNNFPAVAGEWMAVPVSPFVYTGGGLEVYTSSVITPMPGADSASTASTITWRYTSTTPANKIGYYSSTSAFPTASTNFTVAAPRPNIRFRFEQTSNNAGVFSVAAPLAVCPGNLDIKVNVRNNGKNDINTVEIHWMLDGVLQTPVTYNLPIGTVSSGNNNAVVTLGNKTFLPRQGYQLKAWTVLPNGQADDVNSDDTLTALIGAALNGNYTIGGTTPDYPDVVSAAKDLSRYGICGPVTFSIRPGTYTGQVLLDNIAGVSAANTITFVSQNRDTASVKIIYGGTSVNDNYVFRLASTSYVTLKHLAIQGTGGTYGIAIELTGTASYNTIDSCHIITASNSSTSPGALVLRDRVDGSGNVVTNNRIAGGYYGAYFYGTSTSVMAKDIVFDNNLVEGFVNAAVYLYYTNNIKVRNNRILTTNTTATQYGINANYCYGQMELTGNKISLQRGGYGIYAQYCNGTAAAKGLIANNEIVIGKLAAATATINGLRLQYTQYQQAVNNSINVLGGSDTLAFPGYFYFSSATYQGNEIKNNIFANSSTGRCLFIYNAATSLNNVYDYNLYYAAQNTKPFEAGTATKPGTFPTLTEWRTGSSVLGGQDMHSLSYRPPFMAEDDLRPNPSDSAVWAINGRGEQIAGNGRDITGAYRSTTLPGGVPDIGAYEVLPASLPPRASATPANPVASGVQVFTLGEDTVAQIKWGLTVPASIVVRQYSGEMPPVPLTTPADMFFHTDITASAGSYDCEVSVYYRNPWLGNVPAGAENLVRLAKKDGANPWISYTAGQVNITRDILTASGIPDFGQFTGSRPECTGTPVGPRITTVRPPAPLCNGDTIVLQARDLNTTGGISYQWQQAPATSGPWTNVSGGAGANTLQYFSGGLSDTIYYRVLAECTMSGQTAAGDTFMIPVWPAVNLLYTRDSARCGPGRVALRAGTNPGIAINWFDAAGNFIDTGSLFVTPPISQTATFYAAPGTPGAGKFRTGRPAPITTFSNISNYCGVQFDALVPFTLESVVVYSGSTATGTIEVVLHDAFGNVIASATPTVSVVSGQPAIVPLNFYVPAGSGLWLRNPSRSGISGLYYESSVGTGAYPYTVPGVISITGSTTTNSMPPTSSSSTYYCTFYDWTISVGCQGVRTPVTATVTPGPAFSVTNDLTICNDAPTPLTITSTLSNFDRYEWAPLTNLYTDAAGTIPYTGGHAATVYVRSQVAGTYTYVATALNTTSLCGGSDTVKVHIQPAPSAMFVSSVCFNGSGSLKLNPDKGYAPGSIQWESSTDNVNWNTITGATSSAYNSPVLSNTTYYRAQIKNSQGQICRTISDTLKVVNPAIYSATPARRCGLGSVTLQASGSPGARIAWYDVPSGGTPLAIGNTFVTPVVNTTTTFYAAAEESSSMFGGLPYYTDSPATLTQAITGLSFDAYMPFTLNSVMIYVNSASAGTIIVELLDAVSASLNIAVLPVPAGTLVQGRRSVVLPLNFQIPVGSGLRLLATGRGGSYNTLGENGPATFPMNTSGLFSINGGLTAATGAPNSNYYTFYDWRVSMFCEVPRLPVVATIDPAPAIDATPRTLELCLGDTARFGVSSGNNGYSFSWNPGQWTDTSIVTIPTRDITYYIHAIDSSGGPFNSCANLDSVVVIVHPLPSAVVTQRGSSQVCEGDSLSLAAATGLGYVYQWMKNDSLIEGARNSVFAASASGRYKVKVTDNSMCSVESSDILVTAYPAPVPLIVPGHGAALSTADRYVAYQWNYDSIPIPGATQREHTPLVSGDYTVTVTDANGCTGTSAVHLYSVGVTTVAVEGHRIRVYPNPAQEKVFIDADVEVNVIVSDMAGRTLIHSENAKQVDIGAFADGVYLIRVHDLQGRLMTMKKLVKSAR